jgi:hypothetical protein
MKSLVVLTLLLFAFTAPQSITGRWETIQPGGNTLGMIFKPDNHFEGYINRKPFVSGTYTFNDNTIVMNGNGCIDILGKYRIHFLKNTDAILWEVISDNCAARKKGLDNVVFSRIQ